MIRQFIFMGRTLPGGGRDFFDMSAISKAALNTADFTNNDLL